MEMTTVLWLALGFVLLVAGAESLVRGSAGLAARAGLSPLVIGLTVVALGTSSPELAVSISAALRAKPDLAFGNVVGSNIFNILFVLGLSAAVAPLVVARQLVRLDVPIMIGVSVLASLLGLDGRISRVDGVLLAAGLLVYLFARFRLGRREAAADAAPASSRADPLWLQVLFVLGGLTLLVLGSRWLVAGAVRTALALGLPEIVVGLTIVAAGTSLPEAAASVVAALRGQRDIAVGNIVGSNILNLLAVLGITAFAAPDGVAVNRTALAFDVPIMILVAVACLPIFFTGHRISRWEGWLFLGYYAAYTLFLVLDEQNHEAAAFFGRILLFFVVPLTAATLFVLTVRAWRAHR